MLPNNILRNLKKNREIVLDIGETSIVDIAGSPQSMRGGRGVVIGNLPGGDGVLVLTCSTLTLT